MVEIASVTPVVTKDQEMTRVAGVRASAKGQRNVLVLNFVLVRALQTVMSK